MSRLNGAEITIRLLERQGIRTIAGIPGGAALPLYDALSKSVRIRHVLARHEQGAGFIAQGMARVTGEPAVCFATSGPGATNVVTAVADAKLDSIPLICITGQVPQALLGTDAFQEVDVYGLSLPITKHSVLVRSAAELLEAIPAAFRIAMSGRPGPVWVDIPKDVQLETIEVAQWPMPGTAAPTAAPDGEAIARAVRLIDAAERPILCLGGGVVQAGAGAAATRFAERASLPTAMTLMGLGAMPTAHPLALGMLGMHAARFTNLLLAECDLLIGVGMRFDDRATGKVAEFCPKAKIVHIDIDPAEFGKIKAAQVGIEGDARAALSVLVRQVAPTPRVEWLRRVDVLRRRQPLRMPGAGDPRTPYGLVRHVAAALGDEAIVTTDVGQHQMWVAQAYPVVRGRQLLTSGGLGTMGFGLPAAIGAALAAPGRPVACFTGDGSFLMNLQELATAAEEGVALKVILLDNRALGLVHQQQDLFYGRRIFAADYRVGVDFVRLAAAFGLPAVSLDGASDPLATLVTALRAPGTGLIHATIDADEKVFPMVAPGAANHDMIGGETDVDEQSKPLCA